MSDLARLIKGFNSVVDNEFNVFEKEHDIIEECILIQKLCTKYYHSEHNTENKLYTDLEFCSYSPTFVIPVQVTITAFDIDVDLYSNQTGMIKINSNRIIFKDRSKPSQGVHKILMSKTLPTRYYFKLNKSTELVELNHLNELYDFEFPENYSDWGVDEYCLLKMIEE